jgi:hypothetical protein
MSTNTLRTIPELLGKARLSLSTPLLYTPDKIPVEADFEIQALEEIKTSEVTRLDDVMTSMKAQQRALDVGTLLHIASLRFNRSNKPTAISSLQLYIAASPS